MTVRDSDPVQDYGGGSDAQHRPAPAGAVTPILWGSFLVAQLVFFAVGLAVRPADAVADVVLMVVFAMVALSQLVLIFGVVPRLPMARQYLTFCLVRWALAESISIFGLVGLLLGFDIAVAAAFFAVAIGALLALVPGEADRRRHAARHASAPS